MDSPLEGNFIHGILQSSTTPNHICCTPEMKQRSLDIIKFCTMQQQPDPKIIILKKGEGLITSRFFNSFFPEHDHGMVNRITLFAISVDFILKLWYFF